MKVLNEAVWSSIWWNCLYQVWFRRSNRFCSHKTSSLHRLIKASADLDLLSHLYRFCKLQLKQNRYFVEPLANSQKPCLSRVLRRFQTQVQVHSDYKNLHSIFNFSILWEFALNSSPIELSLSQSFLLAWLVRERERVENCDFNEDPQLAGSRTLLN